jgi:hypothetical protein
MLLQEKHRHISTDGVIESKDFDIVFNEKMVKILSDGLYSDKVLAVLRELSANAYDAHVANNCADKPFEVNLPTILNPIFYIRDYGLGLSPDEVKTIYTVYGASNKEDSNDYIGCLGLGSKTPFAYNTRSATVETWRDGTHYIYSIHLNDKGMPVLSKLSEQLSTEPSGVKITLAVSKNDIENFKQKAAKLYRYFKLPPTIKGNALVISPVKYIFQGKGWALRDSNNLNDHVGAVATMGNLAYPISFQDTNLPKQVQELLACKVDFFFKIGDLDIEASREGLSYDNRTKGNITRLAKEAVAEIEKIVTDKIDISPSLWDARLNFQTIKTGLPQNFFQVLGLGNIKWKNKSLFESTYYGHINDTINISQEIKKISKLSYRVKLVYKDTKTISVNENVVFFKNDLKTGGLARVRDYVNNNNDKTAYYFNFDDVKQYDAVIEEIGLLPSHIQSVSTLPKPAKVPKTGGTGTGVKRGFSTSVMKWAKADIAKTYCWQNLVHDLSLGGVYVEVNLFNVVNQKDKNRSFHPRILGNIRADLTNIGLTVPDIIGLKSHLIPKLAKTSGVWTHFNDWATSQVTPLLSKFNVDFCLKAAKELEEIKGYNHVIKSYTLDINEIIEIGKLVDKNTRFYQFYQKVLDCQKMAADASKCESLQSLMTTLDIQPTKVLYTPFQISQLQIDLYKKYHLLAKIATGDKSVDVRSHTVKYINSVG